MLKKHLHQIIYYLGGAAAVVLLLLVAQAAVSQNSGGYQLKDNFSYEKMWTEVDADLIRYTRTSLSSIYSSDNSQPSDERHFNIHQF